MNLEVLQSGRSNAPPRTTRPASPAAVQRDAEPLAADLRKAVRGEVRFDDGSRALYATDASNYRQVPIGVVVPMDAGDVEAAVGVCRQHSAPLLPRGAGTSLAGQCCNVAVVLDCSKHMNRQIEIDPQRRLARVEPGVICDHLVWKANEHGLTYGTGPATHRWCTLGGMIGNNACGKYSVLQGPVMRGRTSDTIQEMEVLTYDGLRMRVGRTGDDELERIVCAGGRRGEIYRRLRDLRDRYAEQIRQRFPRLPRRVSGYNLDELLPENGFHVARALVGTEGTCVTVLEAVVDLEHNPPCRTVLVLGFEDVYRAADHVMQAMAHQPTALEGLDAEFLQGMKRKGLHTDKLRLLPEAGGYLLVEFGGQTLDEANDKARQLMAEMERQPNAPEARLLDDRRQQDAVWAVREAGLGATAHVPGLKENHEGWEDSAVHPDQLGDYLRDLRKLFNKYQLYGVLYGHFGQGCVHTRLDFDLKSEAGVKRFRSFLEEATDLVARYGGSYSGEHGDGQSRAEFLPKLFGPELVRAFEEFKDIWDPQWKMNPGKVVRPFRVDENLRYGPDYHPARPRTHFRFPDDDHDWSHAMERCVGVGKCRREEGGTMCPSYMVLREEKHTTRGRARLLFEMLQGDPLHGGWRSEPVAEALDLCLACKGCKGDCPVNVDMATYKAEFRAHYFKGRLRPRKMFAFGFLPIVARLASFAPTIANIFTQTPGLRRMAKWVADMQPQRQIPPFAPESFQSWFARREVKNPNGRPVLLFPDTFNNYFHPEVSQAAVEVLEDAGFRVTVPVQNVCCGRPLYDYGFLNTAKRWLEDVMAKLRPHIEAGIPIVVLEPSCWSVFFDELTNLFPDHPGAQRLRRNVWLLGEFLEHHARDYPLPRLQGKALLHRHCHHKSELKQSNTQADLLRKMGLDCREPDTGCCGMAGAFGYERGETYEVGQRCGERVLLPEVRQAAEDELIITDGFSCQEMIAQGTDRTALHFAQVVQMAKACGPQGTPARRPETPLLRRRRREHRAAALRTSAMLAVGVVTGGLLYTASRHRRSGHPGRSCMHS